MTKKIEFNVDTFKKYIENDNTTEIIELKTNFANTFKLNERDSREKYKKIVEKIDVNLIKKYEIVSCRNISKKSLNMQLFIDNWKDFSEDDLKHVIYVYLINKRKNLVEKETNKKNKEKKKKKEEQEKEKTEGEKKYTIDFVEMFININNNVNDLRKLRDKLKKYHSFLENETQLTIGDKVKSIQKLNDIRPQYKLEFVLKNKKDFSEKEIFYVICNYLNNLK